MSHKVPTISQDLRDNEVCIRAIQTFLFLDRVVDDVFDKIDARISQNLTRISDVKRR